MVDLAEFGYSGKWGDLLLKYRRGELQKPDVIALLRSDEPVTDEAKGMLADIIENGGKSLKGGAPRKLPPPRKTATARMRAEFAAARIEELRGYIKDPSTVPADATPQFRREISEASKQAGFQRRRGNRVTADAQAKRWVAEHFGVSVRALQEWIKSAN